MDHFNHNNFLIREYQDGDFNGISNLWSETNMGNQRRGDDEKTIAESIRIGGCMLVMIEKNIGSVCGTSWMTYDGRRIHLHHFGILPEYQGKNLSKLLLNESLKFVKRKGCQVKLEVHKSNLIAIDLYKKSGFEFLGDYDVYIIRDIGKIQLF
jgi:[ribosomal protein S18]-alanine N-acetyltransferase